MKKILITVIMIASASAAYAGAMDELKVSGLKNLDSVKIAEPVIEMVSQKSVPDIEKKSVPDVGNMNYLTNVNGSYVSELVGDLLSEEAVVVVATDRLLKMPKHPISAYPSHLYSLALGFTVMSAGKAEDLPGSKWEVLATYEVPAPELPMALSTILDKEFPAAFPDGTGWSVTCLSKRLLSFKRSPNGITVQLKTSPY